MEHMLFMQEEKRWPQWPMLPIKRRTSGDSQLGVLLAGEGPEVNLTNMFKFDPDCEKIYYANWTELVEAGWVVD
jgi:hypothetical protein